MDTTAISNIPSAAVTNQSSQLSESNQTAQSSAIPNTQLLSTTNSSASQLATSTESSLNALPVIKDYVPNARVERMTNLLLKRVDLPIYNFKVSKDADNNPQITTPDGYKITLKTSAQEWTITDANQKTTRIWGDPHVTTGDGKQWDFYNDSTFHFGNNKITVQTVDAGNGTTYSSSISIYNGRERLTVTNIDQDKPTLAGWKLDANSHDENLADGDGYGLKYAANGEHKWEKK